MGDRFRHATHVARVAIVFLAGVVLLLIARAVLVPDDFGTFGFYRAGAIEDARKTPIAYAGQTACEGCHSGTYWSDADDAREVFAANPKLDNRHSGLRCEACHGPMAFHAAREKAEEAADAEGKELPEDPNAKPVPLVAGDLLCLGCHKEITARPEFQPQVLVGDHGDNDACDSCHRPHRPRTDEDEE
jgi:hypothetical protein